MYLKNYNLKKNIYIALLLIVYKLNKLIIRLL